MAVYKANFIIKLLHQSNEFFLKSLLNFTFISETLWKEGQSLDGVFCCQ